MSSMIENLTNWLDVAIVDLENEVASCLELHERLQRARGLLTSSPAASEALVLAQDYALRRLERACARLMNEWREHVLGVQATQSHSADQLKLPV